LRAQSDQHAQSDQQETAWGVLDTSLRSGNLDHRRQALAAIGTIPNSDSRAVKAAEEALQDKDPQVRAAAADALGSMKATQAAPALKDALEDKGEVAFAAAKALVNMSDPAGRDMLVAMIAGDRSDSPGILKNAVRDARKRIHHPEGLVVMGAQDATGAMFGPESSMGIAAVKDAFKLRGVSSRALAAQYLAKDPEPYAISLLEWALTDNSWEVRASAAKALGERGGADSVPKLEKALYDSRDAVRTLAAASIIRIAERQGVAPTTASSH
jgi:HEAT repeat protein